ncbi:MAG: hypothetical protein DMF60_09140 [Acidobacteria bacterium]|nr:MAG: hypothetical protein DMF60_09140 [Acidobacteriota bacterium]
MKSGLARYGLSFNPYELALDPLEDDNHADWLVRVDGFSELDRIDAYIKKHASDKRPLFFMVAGKGGSGRTSVAKFIMSRYRQHRGIDRRQFLPVIREAENHDEFYFFQNWLIDLYYALDSLEIKPTLPKNLTPEEINKALPGTMRASFHGLMMQFNRVMSTATQAGQPAAWFGCFVDNVRTLAYVDAAEQIFKDTGTVCVFTAGDYKETEDTVIKPFIAAFGEETLIKLSDLSGGQVKELVNRRWELVSKEEIPFDLAGIETTFEARARSIGRVLEIFSKLIAVKVPEEVEGPLWPTAAELKHDIKDLQHYLRLFDRY